jgi:uncharacterized damage-inducible protein DinB
VKGLPHEWLIDALEKSSQILGLVLADVSQKQAQTARDGDHGWTALEILCHLRDYQDIFAGRIRRMLEEDNPTFKLYDETARLALVVENDYANQDLRDVLDDYRSTRRWIIDCLSSLRDEQWRREGNFAVDDVIDVEMPVVHTLLHDADHTEQIARILKQ